MRRNHLLTGALITALCVALPGCTVNSRGAAEPMVRMRAEKDLECPSSEIALEQLEIGNRYRARGCGRTKVYRTACRGLECTVANEDEPAIPWADRPAPDEFHR